MDVLLILTQKSKVAGVLDDVESRYGAQILQVDHIRGPTQQPDTSAADLGGAR